MPRLLFQNLLQIRMCLAHQVPRDPCADLIGMGDDQRHCNDRQNDENHLQGLNPSLFTH